MNLFTWLLVGHLVGDWMLQNDWMAQNKKKHLFHPAGLVHYGVYALTMLLVLWLARGNTLSLTNYLLLGATAYITHMLIDGTKVVDHWMRLYHQANVTMVRVMVDQTFHIVVLVGMAWYA